MFSRLYNTGAAFRFGKKHKDKESLSFVGIRPLLVQSLFGSLRLRPTFGSA